MGGAHSGKEGIVLASPHESELLAQLTKFTCYLKCAFVLEIFKSQQGQR
jgi:hypothetical protein